MLLQLDRGFTSTVSQLFQRAKPPERHRPYKVGAADLFRSALFSQFGFVNPEASCRGRHKVQTTQIAAVGYRGIAKNRSRVVTLWTLYYWFLINKASTPTLLTT